MSLNFQKKLKQNRKKLMLKIKYPKYVKPFQKKGVRKIEHFKGRALLADEMRLGKTLQALFWCLSHHKKRPVIIVCPATVKYVWQYQCWEHIKKRAFVIEGTGKIKESVHPPDFIIINYKILPNHMEYLLSLNAQVLIVDECHYIKTRTTQRTKAVWELGLSIPKKIAISGTPLVNCPAELWPTLHLLYPKRFKSFIPYAFRYCKPTLLHGKWVYKGSDNLKELHRMLNSTMMIRRLRKDVLPEYKEPIREVIPLPIENRKEYDEAENDFINWLSKKSRSKAIKASKATKLVQLGYLGRLSAELKMKYAIQWINDFLESTTEKIIISAIHKKIVKQLHDKYKGCCVVVDGKTSGRKRDIAIRSFMKNKKIRVFIGNINAAGVGIDLSKANTVVFVELDWVSGNHTQFEDRAVHINKKIPIHVVYLVARNTIEEKRCRILQNKQKVISKTLDGTAKTNQLNIYDELIKVLKKKGKRK